jgi:acyl-coenzyme A synthetase/AMP-(fatty) acid ligase
VSTLSEKCFWDTAELAACYKGNIALIEQVAENKSFISYLELHQLVTTAKKEICAHAFQGDSKLLIMLVANNSVASVTYYLAALQLGHTVWWVDKDGDSERLQRLQAHYSVNLLIDNHNIQLLSKAPVVLHDDLALLITTSGSTGSPTLVKLSFQNINSNCTAICEALTLQASDMAITTLPLQYSFGLSILNTHLQVGSSIILTEASLMSREFWGFFKAQEIKCLYGVPYSFDMLMKLSLDRLPLTSLRFMAVAGGKLAADKVALVNDYCLNQDSAFYVMYGQTEASARIAVLAPGKVKIKPASIGQAIAGQLWLEDEAGETIKSTEQQGELCYQGENVMMGLAQTQSDLSLPKQVEKLRTGDLALMDTDGDYQIVGRLKRFIKLLGHRVNLDEVEQFFRKQNFHVICTGQDDMIFCYLVADKENDLHLSECQTLLNSYLSIHSNYSHWQVIQEVPYLSSGKVNYQQLEYMRPTDTRNKAAQ